MIIVQVPNTYEAERRYILSVLFTEFLGLDIQINVQDRTNTLISLNDNRNLIITDGLFTAPSKDWLKPESLPQQPLNIWNLKTVEIQPTTVTSQIPIIYGENPNNLNFFQISENQINLGLDIFGSAFFMLTRYEEIVKNNRDNHDRFPATAALAYQENFLHRPIINEYLEILWSCLKYLWSGLERKPRTFQTYLTHDIDNPFQHAFTGIFPLAKRCAGDILKRHQPHQAVQNFSNWLRVKTGNPEVDPCNTFDRIMDISEQHNLRSAFYFITDHTAGKIDGRYNMNHPLIRNLLQKIYQRGHEIGLHPSYNTYQDPQQTKKEFQILQQSCEAEGINQDKWGGRQHYLRWETPTTFQNWNDAGLHYDSTLSYADVAGFRCGICYEYPTFNVMTRQRLKLRERPLTIMERTILDERYMNLTYDLALAPIREYKQACQLFDGDFVILWHNNRLIDSREVNLYQQVFL